MLVRDNAHKRIGKASAETARRLCGNRDRYGRLHHQIAWSLTVEIKHRGLTRKKSSFRRGDDGCESCAAPGLDALIRQTDFIGRTAPGRAVGTIFRPTRG